MTSSPEPSRAGTGRRYDPLADDATGLDLAFDTDSLYGMRATVAAHADVLGLDPEQSEHLLIIASELANNAVRHGGGSGRVRVWRAGDLIHCEVTDSGSGMADPRAGTTPPRPEQIGGRGLWIVRRLSVALDVVTGADGTRVSAAVPVSVS